MNFAEGTVLDKFHYKSHYNLGSSALILFWVTPMHLFSKYRLHAQIFKIPVPYQPFLN